MGGGCRKGMLLLQRALPTGMDTVPQRDRI